MKYLVVGLAMLTMIFTAAVCVGLEFAATRNVCKLVTIVAISLFVAAWTIIGSIFVAYGIHTLVRSRYGKTKDKGTG